MGNLNAAQVKEALWIIITPGRKFSKEENVFYPIEEEIEELPLKEVPLEDALQMVYEFVTDPSLMWKVRLRHLLYNGVIHFAVQDDVFEACGVPITDKLNEEYVDREAPEEFFYRVMVPLLVYTECETRGELFSEARTFFEKIGADVDKLEELIKTNRQIFEEQFYPSVQELIQFINEKIMS